VIRELAVPLAVAKRICLGPSSVPEWRLYVLNWANPKPDKTVTSIDYTSRKRETPAAPFCISINTQEK
jgi:hypothetical protein